MQPNFMPWVDLLPKVGDSVRDERNRLAAKLAEADALERQAAALRAGVLEGRAALLGRVMQWTLHDIELAATAAGDRGQPLPSSFVRDGELREALRAIDGASSSLEVLRAFRACRVIQQRDYFSAATEEERRAALNRVLDWWNYGAAPLLARVED